MAMTAAIDADKFLCLLLIPRLSPFDTVTDLPPQMHVIHCGEFCVLSAQEKYLTFRSWRQDHRSRCR